LRSLSQLAAAGGTGRATLLRALALFVFAAPAGAAVVTVGTPTGPAGSGLCQCATIQCAFDQVAALGGVNTVRITRSATYTAQSARLVLGAGDDVTVEGGYASCDQAVADATQTAVSGAGGSADSVLEFALAAGAVARLRRLEIRDGDESLGTTADCGGYGGGISTVGGGQLRIDDSTIRDNVAGCGAGIYAEGSGGNLGLVLGRNVVVTGNDASHSGGGIMLDGTRMTMDEPGTIVRQNQAPVGGGLYLRRAEASIGAGVPIVGSFYDNRATYGGGIYVEESRLSMTTLDAAAPAAIVDNEAGSRGGGLQVMMHCDGGVFGGCVVTPSSAELAGVRIDGNSAPEGAAAYLGVSGDAIARSGTLRMTGGSIVRNVSRQLDGTPANGAILYLGDNDHDQPALQLLRVRMRDNDGGEAIRSSGHLEVTQSLIAENIARTALVQAVGVGGGSTFFASTVAGNVIGGAAVVESAIDFTLRDSILHQPGKTSLLRSGGTRTVQNVIASEVASLFDIPCCGIGQGDPQFWDPADPAGGDFRLHAASAGIDRVAVAVGATDLEGAERSVDLPVVANDAGPRDLGAYERQALLPLVRNHLFKGGLRSWSANAGAFVADGAHADGTGSVYVNGPVAAVGGEVIGPSQCVPLPARGNYALSGWGKEPSTTQANADHPRLEWQTFLASTTCGGAVASEGGIPLPSGNDWAEVATKGFFSVPNDGGRVPHASVRITLVAVDSSLPVISPAADAYFDEIVLEHVGDGNLPPTVISSFSHRSDLEGDSASIVSAPHFTDPDNDDLDFTATQLPPGITIDAETGVIAGTLSPESAGQWSVTVRASDPFGAGVDAFFTWTVGDVPFDPLVFGDGFEAP